MGTEKKAILLMVLATLFLSGGQLLWKSSIDKAINSYLNWPLVLGFLCYGFSAFFILSAFKSGELSVLYPILATSYIWVGLLSPFFFKTDSFTWLKGLGLAFIFLGVCLVAGGSKND